MDKFLDSYELPKLTQENSKHLKQSIMTNETEVVIKTLRTDSWLNATRPLKKT
jgi:hypothetical protein